MDHYYVNDNSQANGDHEVHKEECDYLPTNKTYLGYFDDCTEAVEEAKSHYSQVNGCIHCSRSCHTS